MTKKRIYNITFFFVLGVVFGLLIKYFNRFIWNFEVSAFDAFQLLVTTFLAWWVAEKLEKDSTQERSEKDILIEKMKIMDETIGNLKKIVLSTDIVQLTDVNRLIGDFDEISHRVVETLNNNYASILSSEENNYTPNLDMLDILCSDDKYRPHEIAIEERGGVLMCMYAPNRLSEIVGTVSIIQDKLFKLQLLLNRA